jgi:hypothetical protein
MMPRGVRRKSSPVLQKEPESIHQTFQEGESLEGIPVLSAAHRQPR